MDISGLTSAAAGGSAAYGGAASLPAGVQSKLLLQSQALDLLPPVSPSGLGGNLDIYAAVGQQTMGALSGRSALELSRIILAGRGADLPPDPVPASGSVPAQDTGRTDPPLGATLDALLAEAGFTPRENPYEFRKDYFAERGSLGGLLDSLG